MFFLIFQGTWNKNISTQANSSWNWARRSTKRVRNKWCRVRKFHCKLWVAFDKKNPQEFIERLKEVINTQFRNENRAVFRSGPYRLRKGFERYSVHDFQWRQLTARQRVRKVDAFKKATMNDKEEFLEQYSSRCSSKQGLSLSAKDCKIDKVPLSILEVMLEKAASLIQTDRLNIPKPGSSDGSYIVAGTCNWIFGVTPGKGGSFKCDHTCINSRTKIC